MPSRNRLLGFLAQRLKSSTDAHADTAQAKDSAHAPTNKLGTPAWSVTSEGSDGGDVLEKVEKEGKPCWGQIRCQAPKAARQVLTKRHPAQLQALHLWRKERPAGLADAPDWRLLCGRCLPNALCTGSGSRTRQSIQSYYRPLS